MSCVSKRSLRRAVRNAANSKSLRISDTCFDVAIIRCPERGCDRFARRPLTRHSTVINGPETAFEEMRKQATLAGSTIPLRNPSLRPGASRLAQEAK